MKPKLDLTLAGALLCSAAVPPLFAGNDTPAENSWAALKTSPGDRNLLLRAVELPADPHGYAAALESSARLVLKNAPADYAGFLALCKAMRLSGRAEQGLPNCKRAMELDATDYPSYRELGLAHAAAGNFKKAEETLRQGVEISSASSQAYYTLANLLEKRGDAVRAHSYYMKGLTLTFDSSRYRALLKEGARRTAAKKAKPAAKHPGAKPPPPPGRKQQAAACLEKFKEAAAKDEPAAALAQSEACLKLSPSDPGLAAERAPLLVRVGRYEEGVKEYTRAAGLAGPKNPLAASCRVKAAETWLKIGDPAKAVEQYNLALADNAGDLNALKGLAAALEARPDISGAIGVYDRILKLDPSDAKVKARRDELKTSNLTNDEMLAELQLRLAIDTRKTALLPDDIKLFKAIKAAEISGAVDFLKGKAPSFRGLAVEQKTADGTRLLLTGAGYKAYNFYATREAVKFFEKQGVGLREIFKLRSMTGAPLFDAAGKLTAEGEAVWRESASGGKNWLLTYEPVPQSPAALKAEKDVQEFTAQGYEEISEPEYLWLLRLTDCPPEVLTADPLNMKIITDGARMRYFVCFKEQALCMNPMNKVLPANIASYRNGTTDVSDSKTSTAFFGTGAVKRHRLCENGKIWNGTP